MRVTGHSDMFSSSRNISRGNSRRLPNSTSRQDGLTKSALYQRYKASLANGTQNAKTTVTGDDENSRNISNLSSSMVSKKEYPVDHAKMQEKIEQLTERLKQDESFINDKNRHFINNPIGRELATATILDSAELQDKIAKQMWESITATNAEVKKNPVIYGPPTPLPANYKDINIKAMLLSGDQYIADQVLSGYEAVLNQKAKTSGLTENERLLSSSLERMDLISNGTFDDRMAPIQKQIEQGFKDAGMTFDKSKSYSFSLDTSNFKFSVTGGTDEENALIEKIINKSHYSGDNLFTTISALYGHRQEDGKYNPWMVDSLPYKEETVPKYGIATNNDEYNQKTGQLMAAYNRFTNNNIFQTYHGFSLDDIKYVGNGNFVGKTDEITRIVADSDIKHALNNIQKSYTGTPVFTEPVFTFENGKFNVLY